MEIISVNNKKATILFTRSDTWCTNAYEVRNDNWERYLTEASSFFYVLSNFHLQQYRERKLQTSCDVFWRSSTDPYSRTKISLLAYNT